MRREKVLDGLGLMLAFYAAEKDGPEWAEALADPSVLLRGTGCWDDCLAVVLCWAAGHEDFGPHFGEELIKGALQWRAR